MGAAANWVPGTVTKLRKKVEVGDVIVDMLNNDYLKVEKIRPASARGYLIFEGTDLRQNVKATISGRGESSVMVRREPS